MIREKKGQVKTEVYMVSDQGQSLIRDDLLAPPDSRKFLKIKNSPEGEPATKFFYEGKTRSQIEPDFFIVNVSHGTPKHDRFNVLRNSGFPVSNRATKPNKQDFITYCFNSSHQKKSYALYSNFHLLLFIAKLFDLETALTICDCIREKRELPEGLVMLISHFVQQG